MTRATGPLTCENLYNRLKHEFGKQKRYPQNLGRAARPQVEREKISIDDSAYGLLAGLERAWGKEKAVAYFKKLAPRNPSL